MKIVVTGGAGFIGANLVRHLIDKTPHEVLNVDCLTYAGNLESLGGVEEHPRYTFRQVDITQYAEVTAIFRAFQPEAVMHLAAESHVDRSIDGPAPFIRTNIVGTCTLLEVCREYLNSAPVEVRKGFRFLHTSTDEVFGSLYTNDPPFSETTPYAPRSPYAASKASSDHLVRAWGETYDLPVLITNCSNNYGPLQFPEKLIPTVILRALRGDPIPVYGKGENVRDWIHVEDHVRALLTVLTRGTPGETYTVGADAERRNIDLARTLCALMDELADASITRRHEDLITFVADRPGHDFRYAIDSQKLRRELGWSPARTLDEGLRETVQWYLSNRPWWQSILDADQSALLRKGRTVAFSQS